MSRDRAATLAMLRRVVERARSFKGWVFGDLSIRHLDPPPPWVYEEEVRERASGRSCAIDMGTGPGERLADLREHLPDRLVAREEWPQNAPRAHARLAPLGVDVLHCRSVQMPFADDAFDLILNRHEELEPVEIARVLQPGGLLITQQVGNDNWRELRRRFPRMTDWGDIHGAYVRGLTEAALGLVSDLSYDLQGSVPVAERTRLHADRRAMDDTRLRHRS